MNFFALDLLKNKDLFSSLTGNSAPLFSLIPKVYTPLLYISSISTTTSLYIFYQLHGKELFQIVGEIWKL